jgi:hypothetical protein
MFKIRRAKLHPVENLNEKWKGIKLKKKNAIGEFSLVTSYDTHFFKWIYTFGNEIHHFTFQRIMTVEKTYVYYIFSPFSSCVRVL